MKKFSYILLLAAVCGALPALSAPIETDKWYHIIVGNSIQATNGANSDPAGLYFDPSSSPWTFTLLSAGTLEVTDAEFNGDYISVFDGSTVFTPNPQGPVFSFANCGLVPTDCQSSPDFWHLTIALQPKTYSLSFVGIDTPFQTSSAFFRVTGTLDTGTDPGLGSVPEPSTYALSASAAMLFVWLRSRRR